MNTIKTVKLFHNIDGKGIKSKINKEDVLKFVTDDVEERLKRLREIEIIDEDIKLYNKILERKKTEETRQRVIAEAKAELKEKEEEIKRINELLKEKYSDAYDYDCANYRGGKAGELSSRVWDLRTQVEELHVYIERCDMTDEELVIDIIKNTFNLHFLDPVLEARKYPFDNPAWAEKELQKL